MFRILEEVAKEQAMSEDRLSLAIPLNDILSYYEAELLTEALTIDEGLLMTLSIPLPSKQTAFSVYRVHTIPIPQPEDIVELRWKTEADYLAISEDGTETAPITTEQLAKCIGSSRYQICHKNIATETTHASCLATLFRKGTIEALGVCDTEKVYLPARDQAENLGFGVWLITSATDA